MFTDAFTLSLWLSCIVLFSGLSFSYFVTHKLAHTCHIPRGGIIVKSEFNHNIEGWELFGQGKIEERISKKETGSLWLTVGRNLQTVSPRRFKLKNEKSIAFLVTKISKSIKLKALFAC